MEKLCEELIRCIMKLLKRSLSFVLLNQKRVPECTNFGSQ